MLSAKTEVKNAINGRLRKIMFGMLVMVLLALVITQSAQAQLSLVSGSSPAPVPTTASDHSVTSPFAGTVNSPCTAEDVLINGKTHMNSQNTESSSGNTRTRMFTHDEGTGQAPSGAGYSYADFNEMVTESKSNESGPSYISFEFNEHLIRQGETTATTGMNGGGDDFFNYFNLTFQFTGHVPSGVKRGQNRTECR